MEYTSDSNLSDDTRELVRQGLASVKRKRVTTALRAERPRERLSVPIMDTSQLRHPFRHDSTNGATSTHGLILTEGETAHGQNHNNMKPSHPGKVLPSYLYGSVSAAGSSTAPVLVNKVQSRKREKQVIGTATVLRRR